MFKAKLNLYNTEWLDLVFSDRNKSYGAYELRKHYNSNILKALFFTAILFAGGLFTVSLLIKHNPDPIVITHHDPEILINLTEITPPKPEAAAPKKQNKTPLQTSGATQKAIAAPSQMMKPVADNLVKEDPKPVTAQNSVTGLQDIPGDIPSLNTPTGGSGNGTGAAEGTDNGVKTIGTLEKLPEFSGGMEGWSKFLSKNLRYPEEASGAGVSGRVFISFIVEKDGRITDIQVLKAAGYGFDEEAKRVLKIAPQWKAGIQNGKAVRVRYTIPINFTISQ